MIVVTGASGTVGRHVLSELAAAGQPLRALSRHPRNPPDGAPMPGDVEWVFADFDEPASLEQALRGARRLVLISPAHPAMRRHQEAVLQAAVAAGVQRIAKLSGLGAGPQAPIRLAREHYAIEESIRRSGIPHSLVRPNLFMQVLLGHAPEIARHGCLHAPAGDGAISFIDARDVAAVLAREVLRDDIPRVIHEISGPQALSFADAAAILGEVLQRPLRFVDLPPADAHAAMLASGLDPWLAEAFGELFGLYRAGHGSAVLSHALEAASARPPTPLRRFAQEHRSHFLAAGD